jgi:hypothetical protein
MNVGFEGNNLNTFLCTQQGCAVSVIKDTGGIFPQLKERTPNWPGIQY